MKQLPDDILITKIQQGDERAFREIYERYWEKLYRLCSYYTTSREEAEDIVAELFLSLWTNREKVVIDHLEHYLVKAAKYKSLNYIERHQRRSKNMYSLIRRADSYYIEQNSPGSKLETKELSVRIHESLHQLPEKTQHIFLLSRENGLTYEEIAGRMGLSVKAVEYHVSRALKTLAKFLLPLFIFFHLL